MVLLLSIPTTQVQLPDGASSNVASVAVHSFDLAPRALCFQICHLKGGSFLKVFLADFLMTSSASSSPQGCLELHTRKYHLSLQLFDRSSPRFARRNSTPLTSIFIISRSISSEVFPSLDFEACAHAQPDLSAICDSGFASTEVKPLAFELLC